jgi:hypothetical protein
MSGGVNAAPRSRAASQAIGAAALALTLATAAGLAWVLLVAHPRLSLNTFVGDDAGYYFAIARNACLGHGLSFDRLHATNGFNPLQTLVLIGADRGFVPGLGILDCYRAGILLSIAAMIAAAVLLVRLAAAFLDRDLPSGEVRRCVIACVVAFDVGFVCMKSLYGLDAPLVLLLGTAWLARVAHRGPLAPGLGAALSDGALLGLLFLARVDHLPFVAAAFLVAAIVARRTPGGAARLAWRGAAAAAFVLPYVLWSRAAFGTWMPVSARIKSSFPEASLARSLDVIRHTSLNVADQASFLVALVAAAALVLAWLLRPRWRAALRLDDGRTAVMTVLTLYVVGRLGYMLLFSRTDVQGGYVILAHVYNLLLGLAGAQALARRAAARAATRSAADGVVLAACGLLILVTAGLLVMKVRPMVETWRQIRPGGAGDEWALARAIHDRTRDGDVIYGGAFGMLGFIADRPWINGDGVANTYDYQRALHGHDLETYLAANHVTHVVYLGGGPDVSTTKHLGAHSALYGTTGTFDVDERQVVLRWVSFRGRGAEVVLARWTPPAAVALAAREEHPREHPREIP